MTLTPCRCWRFNRTAVVFDVGVDGEQNRLSLFVDGHGEICLRYFDNLGRKLLLRSEKAGSLVSYGRPTYLNADLAIMDKEFLLALRVSDRDYFLRSVAPAPLSLPPFHYVLGSDFRGRAETHMSVFEVAIFGRRLSALERSELREYFISSL